jgi:hypothetical protein
VKEAEKKGQSHSGRFGVLVASTSGDFGCTLEPTATRLSSSQTNPFVLDQVFHLYHQRPSSILMTSFEESDLDLLSPDSTKILDPSRKFTLACDEVCLGIMLVDS